MKFLINFKLLAKFQLSLFFFILLVSGCSSAYDSAPIEPPQENNQWISVQGVIPSHVSANIYPQYRSSICKKPRAMSDGTIGTTENINKYKISVQPDPNGRYQGKIALHGGSRCDWKLYKIVFFTLPNEINLYKDRLPERYQQIDFDSVGRSVEVSVIQSEKTVYNRPPISLVANYYPDFVFYLPEETKSFKTLFLRPTSDKKKYTIDYNINAHGNLGTIMFSPTVDMLYTTYTINSGSKIERTDKTTFYYPNGDMVGGEYHLRPYKFYDNK
ncbi:hypothetical protein [Aeromonas rivuli]|uniref:hypothetical protein n=1 Tax=Aeromonas rivuli TaxID=648794 RepID=UPI001CCE63E2|nr:hypothetical protein [Aeromonas rivuli]UBO73955.1 hypothetical protein KYK33_19580 [Aeromonas rivuli]